MELELEKLRHSRPNQYMASQPARSNLPISLRKIEASLAPEERNILMVKYASPRINAMAPQDVHDHALALLLRIHTVTGWILPDDDFYLNTLVSEFRQYLEEQRADLNPEEIAFAIRSNGVGVKDWGRNMNLSLIDDAISRYVEARKLASEVEERKLELPPPKPDPMKQKIEIAFRYAHSWYTNPPPLAVPAPESLNPADWSREWEQVKQAAKNGRIKWLYIPVAMYDWLVKEGMLELDDEEKWELFQQAYDEAVDVLQAKIANGNGTKEDRWELKALMQPNWKEDPVTRARMANAAKVLAVKQLAMGEVMGE